MLAVQPSQSCITQSCFAKTSVTLAVALAAIAITAAVLGATQFSHLSKPLFITAAGAGSLSLITAIVAYSLCKQKPIPSHLPVKKDLKTVYPKHDIRKLHESHLVAEATPEELQYLREKCEENFNPRTSLGDYKDYTAAQVFCSAVDNALSFLVDNEELKKYSSHSVLMGGNSIRTTHWTYALPYAVYRRDKEAVIEIQKLHAQEQKKERQPIFHFPITEESVPKETYLLLLSLFGYPKRTLESTIPITSATIAARQGNLEILQLFITTDDPQIADVLQAAREQNQTAILAWLYEIRPDLESLRLRPLPQTPQALRGLKIANDKGVRSSAGAEG